MRTPKAIRYSVNTYPICDSPLSRFAQRSFAPFQKSRRNHRSHVWTEALSDMGFLTAGVKATSFPGFSPTRPTLRRAGRREPWERGWRKSYAI